MRGLEGLAKLPRRPLFPLPCILEALADALLSIGTGGNVKQQSPERRRNVVNDWMSFAMSSTGPSFHSIFLDATE